MEEAEGMEWWHELIGSDAHRITWWQMCIRAVFIFCAGLLLLRVAGKRTFGKETSFDILVSIILGSMLGRAATGNARFLPTLAASGTLVLLHYLFGKISLYSHGFGRLVKGVEAHLIKDGEVQWEAMRRTNMTAHDLREAARLKGVPDLGEVQNAFLERSGSVSVFKKKAS